MASIDANTLADATRVRRTVLSNRHSQALRDLRAAEEGDENGVVDNALVKKCRADLESVTEDIQAEYADDPTMDPVDPTPPAPSSEPPKGK